MGSQLPGGGAQWATQAVALGHRLLRHPTPGAAGGVWLARASMHRVCGGARPRMQARRRPAAPPCASMPGSPTSLASHQPHFEFTLVLFRGAVTFDRMASTPTTRCESVMMCGPHCANAVWIHRSDDCTTSGIHACLHIRRPPHRPASLSLACSVRNRCMFWHIRVHDWGLRV